MSSPRAPTPRTQMAQLVQLIRTKLIREPSSPASAATDSPPKGPSSTCWLCAAETQSQFQCVDGQPLCLGCFQICYTATLRPQLLGDSQGYELAERLKSAEIFESPIKLAQDAVSSGTHLMSSQSMRTGESSATPGALGGSTTASQGDTTGSWRCHRCTYNNPNYLSYCEVCDAGSPVTVNCGHCGMSCSNVNASPMRSTINRARVGGTTAAAAAAKPPTGYPTPGSTTASADPPRSICVTYNMEHEVWECEKCTFVNTIACRACTVCQTSRMWTCTCCQYDKNTSRCGKKGERNCTKCGSAHNKKGAVVPAPSAAQPPQEQKRDEILSDSVMKRIGLDPAEAKRERERTERLEQNRVRLINRLKSLGLTREVQVGDGNCQFRGLSHQLFGTPEHHMLLRHLVMLHIWKEKAFYELLFDTEQEFTRYWKTMSMSGTWGDEITLRAAADTFGVHLHIITSDEQRWHLHFSPERVDPAEVEVEESTPTGKSEKDFAKLSHKKDTHQPHLFMLYLAPVHYDDIVRPARLPNFAASLQAILKKLKEDESHWDDAMEDPKKKRSLNNDVEWVEVTPQNSTACFSSGVNSPQGIPATSMTFQGPSNNSQGESAMVMVNHGQSGTPTSQAMSGSGAVPAGKIKIRLVNSAPGSPPPPKN